MSPGHLIGERQTPRRTLSSEDAAALMDRGHMGGPVRRSWRAGARLRPLAEAREPKPDPPPAEARGPKPDAEHVVAPVLYAGAKDVVDSVKQWQASRQAWRNAAWRKAAWRKAVEAMAALVGLLRKCQLDGSLPEGGPTLTALLKGLPPPSTDLSTSGGPWRAGFARAADSFYRAEHAARQWAFHWQQQPARSIPPALCGPIRVLNNAYGAPVPSPRLSEFRASAFTCLLALEGYTSYGEGQDVVQLRAGECLLAKGHIKGFGSTWGKVLKEMLAKGKRFKTFVSPCYEQRCGYAVPITSNVEMAMRFREEWNDSDAARLLWKAIQLGNVRIRAIAYGAEGQVEDDSHDVYGDLEADEQSSHGSVPDSSQGSNRPDGPAHADDLRSSLAFTCGPAQFRVALLAYADGDVKTDSPGLSFWPASQFPAKQRPAGSAATQRPTPCEFVRRVKAGDAAFMHSLAFTSAGGYLHSNQGSGRPELVLVITIYKSLVKGLCDRSLNEVLEALGLIVTTEP